MVYLKEDGSLDIERINKLPVEEHMDMLGELASKQWDYYTSTMPLTESVNCPRNIIIDYTMEDEIKNGTAVVASAFLKELREKHGISKGDKQQ